MNLSPEVLSAMQAGPRARFRNGTETYVNNPYAAREVREIPRAVLNLRRFLDVESSRYALSCLMLRRTGEVCEAAATDGHTLAVLSWRFVGGTGTGTWLVPAHYLAALAATHQALPSPIFFDEATPGFRIGELQFAFTPAEGRYPNIDDVIGLIRGTREKEGTAARMYRAGGLSKITSFVENFTDDVLLVSTPNDAKLGVEFNARGAELSGVGCLELSAFMMPQSE